MFTRAVLIFFVIAFSLPLRAAPMNFHFHQGRLQLSDEMFNRFGIPQMRSLVNEYYHLIRSLAPDSGEIISLREQLLRFQADFDRWRTNCQLPKKACHPEITELTRQLRSMDQQTLRHLLNRLKYTEGVSQDQVDSLIWLENTLTQISLLNYRVLHILEQIQVVSETSLSEGAPQFRDLHLKVHEMLTLSEISLTRLLPAYARDDFHALWIGLIKPLEQRVVQNRDKDFYLDRLEQFNTLWNSFHMRMTRGTSELPRPQQNQTRVMHNRWNSIMRIILR
jgi:DNA-binding transcriptional ArsR family regulator